MTYHREWWQTALEIALIIVMSFAFGMIVVAVRGPRRVRMSVEQRKKMGILGSVVFALSIVGWLETEKVRAPIATPAPAASASEIVTETSFESTDLPAVKIDAPEGWRLSYDRQTKHLSLANAEGTMLVIYARYLEAGGSAAGVRNEVKKQLESSGQKPVEFEENIDGRNALGMVSVGSGSALAGWSIDRGNGLVSVVQCRTAPNREARTACRPALDRLHWVVPNK